MFVKNAGTNGNNEVFKNIPTPFSDQLPPFVCPECGGSEITIINYTRTFAALSLLFSLPLFFFAKRHVCNRQNAGTNGNNEVADAIMFSKPYYFFFKKMDLG